MFRQTEEKDEHSQRSFRADLIERNYSIEDFLSHNQKYFNDKIFELKIDRKAKQFKYVQIKIQSVKGGMKH